jgi:hypothetical protein
MIKNRITQRVISADELSHAREHVMISSSILLRLRNIRLVDLTAPPEILTRGGNAHEMVV